MLSYWENTQWFSDIDVTIVGAGIVGLMTAYHIKKIHPGSKILILEKGILPKGASTKNAGFACFGSVSEIMSDLKTHSKAEVVELIKMRWQGLTLLRDIVGDQKLRIEHHGGYEIFPNDKPVHEYNVQDEIHRLNEMLVPIFGSEVFSIVDNTFGFENVKDHIVKNAFESQIDTGAMMSTLLKIVRDMGVMVLNGIELTGFQSNDSVDIQTSLNQFSSQKLCITTNGFAKDHLDEDVQAARAQVLITEEIPELAIQGTFHFDDGYYYFRNIKNRILFGGGRNLDFGRENTNTFGVTTDIQNKLQWYIQNMILPNRNIKIDYCWSGIMGVGSKKKPIVKKIAPQTYIGVRLGGMGVAIGSLVGKNLAQLCSSTD